MSVEVLSLGCRLNLAESETMRTLAGDDDDLVIVNSCAVTNEAVRQTRQAIRRARRRRPEARILVTGCAAEIDPKGFGAMPEVDGVLRQAEKLLARSYVPLPGREGRTEARDSVRGVGASEASLRPGPTHPLPLPGREGSLHARAFIPVQTGCDHACTFCIIPQGRGRSRSEPAGAVVDAVARAVDAGHREVVLTGVDVTSYGPDLPGNPSLGSLVERILTLVPRLERLRLSSLDSAEMDDRLFALVTGEPRVMPHLHLSLQAGDDMILKRMKRRHSRADAVRLVERLKAARPEIAIGADIIAGFPTETDAMFENSLALIDDCDIVHAHVFPFSPRTGTPAARMPQVTPSTVKSRAALLRKKAAARRETWLRSLSGSVQPILIEKPGDRGHAPNFAEIHLEGSHPVGMVISVIVTGLVEGRLIGKGAA